MLLTDPIHIENETPDALRDRRRDIVRHVLLDTLIGAMAIATQTEAEWKGIEVERWGKQAIHVKILRGELARCRPNDLQELIVQRFFDASQPISDANVWPAWVNSLIRIVHRPLSLLADVEEWMMFPVKPIIDVRSR